MRILIDVKINISRAFRLCMGQKRERSPLPRFLCAILKNSGLKFFFLIEPHFQTPHKQQQSPEAPPTNTVAFYFAPPGVSHSVLHCRTSAPDKAQKPHGGRYLSLSRASLHLPLLSVMCTLVRCSLLLHCGKPTRVLCLSSSLTQIAQQLLISALSQISA